MVRRRTNMPPNETGSGVGGKYPVVGILDRATGKVRAEAVDDTKKDELQGYLEENVRGDVHTNSLESFWSMLKRGYVGVYHRFSEQHLDGYVKEYAMRRSMRELDTIDQMTELIAQFWGVRLSWSDLVADRATTL